MALEDCACSAEGYGVSVEQGGVEGAAGFRVEDVCVFLCGGFVKGGEPLTSAGEPITACPPVMRLCAGPAGWCLRNARR